MDWPGLISDVNPHDLPLGAAQEQDNLQCARLGVLAVRKGLRPVEFTEEIDTIGDVLALYGYRPPTRHYAAFQAADGGVYLGNLPASLNPIEGGVSPLAPSCFAQDRFGNLIRVNGLQRGMIFDGKTAWKLGITPPEDAPTVTGSGSDNTYHCGYRYVDANGKASSLSDLATLTADDAGPFTWSNLQASQETDAPGRVYRVETVELYRSTANQSTTLWLTQTLGNRGEITSSADEGGKVLLTVPEDHNLAVGATILVAGHSVEDYNGEHTVTAVDDTTVETDVDYTADGEGGFWLLTGFTGDSTSDDDLEDATPLPIYNPDGSPNARRFDAPSSHYSVAVPFQDRLFLLVPSKLPIEEFAEFVDDWDEAIVGRYIYRDGYRPEEVLDCDELNLALSESGAVDVYDLAEDGAVVYGHQNARNLLVYSETDEFEAVPETFNQVVIQENTDDNDALVGAIPAGSALYLCKERHTYAAHFVRQPRIDLIPTLQFYRGLLNQRCWDFLGDTCFLWDTLGVWSIRQDQMEALSPAIQDFFRDGLIDWDKQQWFFTAAEPNENIVRFHVALVGDDGDYPTRALCYSPVLKKWWTESYHVGLCGKCRLEVDSVIRTMVGGAAGEVLLVAEGTSDWVEAVSGTATAAGEDSLTDSGAAFDDSMVGAPVAITWGTGRGQLRVIETVDSATQITVSAAWETTPDTTSQYTVGAIPAYLRSGLATVPEEEPSRRKEDGGERTLVIVHPPTDGDELLLVEGYFDHDASPEIQRGSGRINRVITTDGSASVRVPLQAAQSVLGNVPGYKRLPWRLKARPKGDSRRFFSFRLECYQGAERLSLYGLEWDQG